ncbi:MAG: hypothetical protein J4F36_11300 [Nitrosopumilaceae archaeon]|nr:hypothetical protein [Nitrosopumilaceae archaeon]
MKLFLILFLAISVSGSLAFISFDQSLKQQIEEGQEKIIFCVKTLLKY